MLDAKAVSLAGHRDRLGESPVWDSEAGLVRWCDIVAGRIFAASPEGLITSAIGFGEPVAAIGLAGRDRLVVAFTSSVEIVDLKTQTRKLVARIPLCCARERLNDGKVGPDGAFWVGSTNPESVQSRKSSLYRVTAAGEVEDKIAGIGISNGLAWSADGTEMFHADTATGDIHRWSFTRSGALSDRRHFARVGRDEGLPDGGCCDADGNYWSAGVTAGRVNQFGPDGKLKKIISVKMTAPTAMCFIGRPAFSLFVTSLQRSDMSSDDGATAILPNVGRASSEPSYSFGQRVLF